MPDSKKQPVNPPIAASDNGLFQRAAERPSGDRIRFVLSDVDWAAFTEALDRPVQAAPALVELFRRPRPA